MKNRIKIIEPKSAEEVDAYFRIRFEVLRKPWNQPISSTKDSQEDQSIHFLAQNENGEFIGTGRLQLNSENEGQIRSMAILDNYQSKGIGSLMIDHIESFAKNRKIEKIILDARENAIPFYEKKGYQIVEKSYLLFDTIQHYKMEKHL